MSLHLLAPPLGGATAILPEGWVELGAPGASRVLQAFPGPQLCRKGDLCQEVPNLRGNSLPLGSSPEAQPFPCPAPAHLIGLAGESRSAAETWPTSVPGALFSDTAR